MAESAFLNTVADYLRDGVALLPAPALSGVAEPVAADELPAVVLALETVRRLGSGLGERAVLISDGALPWRATIDLAAPFLPGEPGFSLLSPDRRTLILPHGGLRQRDGSEGPLSAPDLQVSVAGAPRTLVAGAPNAGQFRVDPLSGQLLFGAALPATGLVVADYVLGQWERRTVELEGSLLLAVWAANAVAATTLSTAAVDALFAAPQAGIPGLRKLALTELGPVVALQDNGPPAFRARVRRARFTFQYTHEINRPDSSGGVIQRIAISSRLEALHINPLSGLVELALSTENSELRR